MATMTVGRDGAYRSRRERLRGIVWFALAALWLGGCRTPSELGPAGAGPRSQVFSLRTITVEQGMAFLSDLGLSAVSPAPKGAGLLVEASLEELRNAAVVLDLVDVNEPYVVQRLAPAAEVRGLPSNEQLAESIGNITIGTFAAPPAQGRDPRAVIDIHADSVWAVAPARLWPDIRAVVESGGRAFRQRRDHEPPSRPDTQRAGLSDEPGSTSHEQTIPAPVAEDHALPESSAPPVADSSTDTTTGQQGRLPSQPPEDSEQPASPESPSVGRVIPAHPSAGPSDSESAASGTLRPVNRDENGPAAGQRRPQVPLDNGDDILELSLPERINLVQFIDLVSGYLRLDCIYDADKIADQVVTLKLHSKLQSEIRVKDLYVLLETILRFKGLAMTRHEGSLVTIVPVAEALEGDPDLIDPNTASLEAGDMVVTRIFQFQHIDVVSVANLLQNMRLGVAVSPIEESQTLFVTCYAQRMGRISQLVEMVDRPGRPREFRFRQLRHTVARRLAEKVIGLAAELQDIPITIAAESREPAGAPAGSRLARRVKAPAEPGAAPAPMPASVYLDVDERTNRILMIGYAEQLGTVEVLIDALDIPEQDVRILSVYGIRHVDAEVVMTKLTELGIIGKPAPGSARAAKAAQPAAAAATEKTPDEELQVVLLEAANALLANATREQHDRLESIISHIDTPPQELRTVQVYTLEHIEAEEALDKLERLELVRAANGPAPRLTEAPAPAPARAAPAGTPKGEMPAGHPQGLVLEGTNSLLVRATDSQHAAIEAMLRHLDVQAQRERIPYEIYFLENQDPSQLAEVLTKLIQETQTDKEGKVERVVPKVQEQITVVPDTTTFSLIVYASRRNQEWLADLVEKLDKRRPQVLIDVTLVEITEMQAFTYDLNLIQSFPDLTATSGLTGTLVPGQSPITSGSIIDKLEASGRSQFVDYQSNGGNLTAFYGDRHINLLLRAMESKDYGRILAKPKILVNDNEPGVIKTADITYVAKSSSIPVSSGGAGTDATLIQTAIDYEPYEAGITLKITPHISQGDLLRLGIELIRSDFRETVDEDKPPNTTSSELTTTAFVPDGCTVILGGLLKLNQNKGAVKVPLLGDLPLLGGLFRSINNKGTQSKLYIFVRAEIIRPTEVPGAGHEDLMRISDQNREAFERHEHEFQSYQTWPGIEPKPVEPAKVLEAR